MEVLAQTFAFQIHFFRRYLCVVFYLYLYCFD